MAIGTSQRKDTLQYSARISPMLIQLATFLIELIGVVVGGGGIMETEQEIFESNDAIVVSKVLYDPTIVISELTQYSWRLKDNDNVSIF
jgi:hypothetical protein